MKESLTTKLIDILKNFRVWILIFFLIASIFAVNLKPNNNGVVINGVRIASPAEEAGLSFSNAASQTSYEKVILLDGKQIQSETDYFEALEDLEFNKTFKIITNKNPLGYEITITPKDNQTIQDLIGISVTPAAKSNIKLGIELEGGSRLILKPKLNLTDAEFDLLISSLQNRLDVYGASGTKVNKLEDAFSNEKFVIVESTSSNKNDIFELISRQGKFEAIIDNETVFTGENVVTVFNDAQRSGLESCSNTNQGITCTYRFMVSIDDDGATAFLNAAQKLDIIGTHLSKPVEFYLDGNKITELQVASSFKSQKVPTPTITVGGSTFANKKDAEMSATKEAKLLRALLLTESLQSELDVVQSYSISSSRGQKLLDNAALVGLAAVLLVSSIVALRYRKPLIFIGIFIALVGEVIIVFGAAAFLKITIDLSAIGGLIAAIGTGVDDQVIITDEYFRKRNNHISSKKKIKNAIYIIMIAYFTTLAAMIPLMFAGLKMIQGFAFMILIGVTVGVLITRPAYAAMLRIIMTKREDRLEEQKEEE